MESTAQIVYVVAVVLTGSLVGVEFGVVAFTGPIIDRLPDAAYRQARSDGSRLLGRVMPFWYAAASASLIALAVTALDVLIVAALVLMAAVMVLTLAVLVPINNRVGAWQSAADVSRELADTWDRWHWLRVALLAVLLILVVLSAVLR